VLCVQFGNHGSGSGAPERPKDATARHGRHRWNRRDQKLVQLSLFDLLRDVGSSR
jgi:hypothetical protein